MADPYVEFSFIVAVDQVHGWAHQFWSLFDAAIANNDIEFEHPIFGPGEVFGLPLVEPEQDGLWFHDDSGFSDIDTTIALVQWVLTQPGTPATVQFTWAESCSRPLPDAYGGGAALVSATAVATVHTAGTSIAELLAADLADQHADER